MSAVQDESNTDVGISRADLQLEIKARMFAFSDKAASWTLWGNLIITLMLIFSSVSSAASALVYFEITEKDTAMIGSLTAMLVTILTGMFNKFKFTDNSLAARQTSGALDVLLIKTKDVNIEITELLKEYADIIGENSIARKRPD